MNLIEIQEKLNNGLYISTKAEIIEDQKSWAKGDESKTTDFSKKNFWITTDSGAAPVGYDSLEHIENDLFL